MSEKKSWDIQPRARKSAPAPEPIRSARSTRSIPTPIRRMAEVKPLRGPKAPLPKTVPAPPPIIRREKVVQGRDREPLKARRKRARRRLSVLLSILAIVIIGAGFAALWSPALRIQYVEAAGPDSNGIEATALSSLGGVEDYVVPRNSIFFFPEETLRTQLLQQYPDVSAVSISRTSLDTIYIVSVARESAFLWCGATYEPDQTSAAALATSTGVTVNASSTSIAALSTGSIPTPCYDADAQGDVFAPDTDASPDTLRVYDPLASSSTSEAVAVSTTSPLGQYVDEADMIPNALQFVKAIKSLGVPIVSLVIRGDEADLYAQSGTRITYVLGTEEQTAVTAASAFPQLNLNNGSLAYVDLRFSGKVYYKKSGTTTPTNNQPAYSSAVSCYLEGKCKIN